MDFHLLFKSVKEACQNSPILIISVLLVVCFSFYLMLDAHRNKKKRARHRWK